MKVNENKFGNQRKRKVMEYAHKTLPRRREKKWRR